jgi:hypothetical protein
MKEKEADTEASVRAAAFRDAINEQSAIGARVAHTHKQNNISLDSHDAWCCVIYGRHSHFRKMRQQ